MLNFKDWKLSSQDGAKATLVHANGHQMVIAMNALPRIQKQQIMRLAKANEYKDGGEVQHFADDPGGVQAEEPVNNPATGYANEMAKIPDPQIEPSQAGPSGGVLNDNGQANPGATAQMAQAGLANEKLNNSALANASIPVEQQRIVAEGAALTPVQKAQNAFADEIKKADGDIVVNPHRYMDQMSGGKRTLSGLGLILGGMGAGQGNENQALRFINNQIDRDIDAQKATFNNRKTVWGAYHDLFGDSVTTNALARATMERTYDHTMKLMKDKLGTPIANAAYQQASAALANQTQQNIKAAALAVPSVPGYTGHGYDPSAANVPRPTEAPGQQGPETAQAAPGTPGAPSGEYVDADGNPVDAKKLSMAGISKASTNGELQEKGIYPKEAPRAAQIKDITAHEIPSILKDNADELFKGAQYDSNKAPYYKDVVDQKKNAAFVDQNLKQMNKLYAQAIDATEKAGVSGRVRDAGSSVIGGVAGAVGSLFGHGAAAGSAGAGAAGALDTRELRLRNNALQGLESVINASLSGVKGVDAYTVAKWVEGAKPVYGDTPNDIKTKYHNLIELVKGHVPKDLIKDLVR